MKRNKPQIGAFLGQTVGKKASGLAKNSAINSPTGKALTNDADRAQRVANQPKRSQSRQEARQFDANQAQIKLGNYVSQ